MGRPLTPQEEAEFNRKRREALERNAALMGISVEEIERREAAARAALDADTEWEKELDAKNRARAGIE